MFQQINKYFFAIVLLMLFSSQQGVFGQQTSLQHFYDYQWSLPTRSDQVLSTSRVSEKLKGYDVIFFGELHNHPAIHLAQMELFSSLYSQNPAISLSLEQFERDTQPLLDQYLNGDIGEEYLVDQARAWPNYQSSYRPLVEFARNNKLPVIAANAPKQMVVCVGRLGLEALDKYPADQRQHVALHIDISRGPYRDKFLAFMQHDSPHKTPANKASKNIMQSMSERSFAAQMVRDDTMAESLAHHIQRHPGRQVLHLNGYFHSSAFLGTVERLQQRMPDIKIAVIHPDTGQQTETSSSASPLGNILIKVLPLPPKFVKDENRNQWFGKMMEKRMESRKQCPR